MSRLSAADLMTRLKLTPHVEGGAFRELYRDTPGAPGRRPSGVIYYALDVGERSDFHVLDSDEYWLYHAGASVEIWIAAEDGVRVERLGIGEGDAPCVLLPGGTVFGARLVPGAAEGCVMSCVTVPEFSYDHYRILSRDEVIASWPDACPFFAE